MPDPQKNFENSAKAPWYLKQLCRYSVSANVSKTIIISKYDIYILPIKTFWKRGRVKLYDKKLGCSFLGHLGYLSLFCQNNKQMSSSDEKNEFWILHAMSSVVRSPFFFFLPSGHLLLLFAILVVRLG